MKLIVGLGNPGKGYTNNRHNVGFQCVDNFARRHKIQIKERRLGERSLRSKFATGEIDSTSVVLAKPRTFMNLSGDAVSQLVRRFKIAPGDIIIIHDDMDLPPGKIRIRQRGGSGGHKGIASIINSLESDEFIRIRVGIGHPENDEVSYVLDDFSLEDRQVIDKAVKQVSNIIDCILSEGIEAAMNRFN